MKFTYYGHACFSVEIGNRTLLFDPFIKGNPHASNINLQDLKADYILISHGHGDHLADAPEIAKRTGATVVGAYEVVQWLAKQGATKNIPLNHGGSCQLDGCRVKFVNAIHSSGLPDGTYGGNPGGFVVQSDAGNFYYAGDTALTRDMELIGESVKLNFAVFPIGGNYTMDADDAIRAAKYVSCKEIVGVHYDSFPVITIDHEKTVEKFRGAGLHLHLLKVGASEKL